MGGTKVTADLLIIVVESTKQYKRQPSSPWEKVVIKFMCCLSVSNCLYLYNIFSIILPRLATPF